MRDVRLVVLALLSAAVVAGCGTAAKTDPAAGMAGTSASPSGIPVTQICGGDAVFTTLPSRFDGTLRYCRGFAGDADHVGEGRAGLANAEGPSATAVEAYMLMHARSIYNFVPTAAWSAQHPHGRDMEGFFHFTASPAPGGNTPRAYKDFLTPPAGRPGHEKQIALVAVIVSAAPQADPVRHATYGGIWMVGCLDRPKPDQHEYLDPCPAWVWSGTAVVSTTQHL